MEVIFKPNKSLLSNLGDPCTISSQRELDEAIRLLHANGEAELNVHVFLGIPPLPGLPCHGEDSMVFTLFD